MAVFIEFAYSPLHSAKFSCSRPEVTLRGVEGGKGFFFVFRGGSPLHGTPLMPYTIRSDVLITLSLVLETKTL